MTAQPTLRALPSAETLLKRGSEVIRIEAEALHLLANSLEYSFVEACEAIISARGRVVITGMGKSGHIGRKWAATMAATGTPAIYVHPAEAAHGDLGMLVPGDVLVVISNSGNTSELRAFLRYAASIKVKVIGIAARRESLVIERADIKLCLPATREACPANIAPTTSTTLQLALGDALAMTLMDMRGFSRDGLKALHPGGSLGLRLTPVSEIMHGPTRMPLVDQAAPMRDVIVTMTSTGFGIAGVVGDDGRLAGIITDGDLRRHMSRNGDILSHTAAEIMTPGPVTIHRNTLAAEALHVLEQRKITAIVVVDSQQQVEGVVHLHDLWHTDLF
jgi:arabinose-5-phosphate isomerase